MTIKQYFDEVKHTFPVYAFVTQEILDKAQRENTQNCIGYHTTKESMVVPEEFKITWGTDTGYVYQSGDADWIAIQADTNMMKLTEPTMVTLTLELKGFKSVFNLENLN